MSPPLGDEAIAEQLLQRLWQILFQVPGKDIIQRGWISGLIKAPINFVLRNPLPLPALIKELKDENLLESALDETMNSIRTWTNLSVESKAEINRLAKMSLFSGYLDWVPELSEEERAELRFKWYVADSVFSPYKDVAIKELGKVGFTSQSQSIDFSFVSSYLELVTRVGDILQDLAKARIETDLALVYLEDADNRTNYFKKIEARANFEAVGLANHFQYLSTEMIFDLASSQGGLDSGKIYGMIKAFIWCPLSEMVASIPTKKPSPEILSVTRKLLHGETTMISLSGTNIGNIIGGAGNTVTFEKQINVAASSSQEEKDLKKSLIDLRGAIEQSEDLKPFQKTSSLADLDNLTVELSKSPEKQDDDSKIGFWSRLKDTVSVSSGLTTMAMAVGKVLGFVS